MAEFERADPVDRGPLMWSSIRRGIIGRSTVVMETRTFAGLSYVEYLLRVNWAEEHKVLKWSLPLGDVGQRIDAIAGGELERRADGREYPFADWTLIDDSDGSRGTGIVCCDAYSLDVTEQALRLTLLRSPYLAHHDPHPARSARGRIADQGEHTFRIRVFHGEDFHGEHLTTATLKQQAANLRRPPAYADLTRGMPGWIGAH